MEQFREYLSDSGIFAITLLVAGGICFFLEKLRPAEKNTPFFKRDFKKEMALALLNAILLIPFFGFLVTITIIAALEALVPYQMFGETLAHLPLMVQIPLGLAIMDFSTYWRHRLSHHYWWQYHSFHHSAEEITWITSLRLHPVDALSALLFDTVILYFIGFEGVGIAGATMVLLAYNYFTHLNIDIQFRKPLCYILASPHYHRWHHANDKRAYEKNFCAIFSFYDVIFGTFYHPEELPGSYGLDPDAQKKIPQGLIAHLWMPIQNDIKKLFRR